MYSASKFAIEGYCEALRLEVSGFGINVTVLAPGDFATAFTAQRKSVIGEDVQKAYPTYVRSLASIEKTRTRDLSRSIWLKRFVALFVHLVLVITM